MWIRFYNGQPPVMHTMENSIQSCPFQLNTKIVLLKQQTKSCKKNPPPGRKLLIDGHFFSVNEQKQARQFCVKMCSREGAYLNARQHCSQQFS